MVQDLTVSKCLYSKSTPNNFVNRVADSILFSWNLMRFHVFINFMVIHRMENSLSIAFREHSSTFSWWAYAQERVEIWDIFPNNKGALMSSPYILASYKMYFVIYHIY